ncbi:MAG: hypothetical protein A4E60_00458 [Syntrophorhabdus sp. PtaB.Bin047]|nr:MAG: hypothetical protein A4E60_00458 [Syntrophorhabdus sp. PtaB.Bin047]
MIFQVLRFVSRASGKISSVANELSSRFAPGSVQEDLVLDSTSYDMVNATDEAYYAEQYWSVFSRFLTEIPDTSSCLDLGCGQGRFSLKLAERFPRGTVLACDISEKAIAAARINARNAGLKNVDFEVSSIEDALGLRTGGSRELIMMTEVSFYYPGWREQMPGVMRVLKPGGLLVASFRSQYFDALCSADRRYWDDVPVLLGDRKGRIFNSPKEFSWQRSEELRSFLTRDCGLNLLVMFGIGVCSGIPGDPHEHIVRPSELNGREREHLMRLEMGLGESVPDAGRYILAVARKGNQKRKSS